MSRMFGGLSSIAPSTGTVLGQTQKAVRAQRPKPMALKAPASKPMVVKTPTPAPPKVEPSTLTSTQPNAKLAVFDLGVEHALKKIAQLTAQESARFGTSSKSDILTAQKRFVISRSPKLSMTDEREKKRLKMKKEALVDDKRGDKTPPKHGEREAFKKRFGDMGVSLARDDKGIYAYTHRCRSPSYDSVEKMNKQRVTFVGSTG